MNNKRKCPVEQYGVDSLIANNPEPETEPVSKRTRSSRKAAGEPNIDVCPSAIRNSSIVDPIYGKIIKLSYFFVYCK